MPVVASCPRCRGVLAGTGRHEQCPRCGEVVVAFARKLCSRCGTDISSTAHRFRDEHGEYYCEACWPEACAEVGLLPGYVCSLCRGQFAGEEVYKLKVGYICHTCHAAASDGATAGDQAQAVLEALARAGPAEDTIENAAASVAPGAYSAAVAARTAARARRDRRLVRLLIAGAVVVAGLFVVWVIRGRG